MNEEEDLDFTADDEEEQQDAGTTKPSTSKSGGDTGKKGKKSGKKGKGAKKKGKKKKKGRKIKLAKDMVMNDRGEIVTTREYLLEKTLASTTQSLHSCQKRLEDLTSSNEKLQDTLIEQEKDALQVIAALHKDNEKVELKMKDLQVEIRRLTDEMKVISDNVKVEYEKKLNDLKAVLAEKESAYRVMQQEFVVIKDFRRKRQDLLKELEDSKIEQAETEKRHRDIVNRLEKKFFEEKIRLQKDANKKIGELAAKAHKEAVTNLKDTTKDVYKENIRMSEALIYHVEEGKELNRINNELMQKNRELTEENDLHGVIIKEKIMQSKKQEAEIERLKEKTYSMEHALTHVVQEFEQERVAIGKLAKAELVEVKKVVTDLSTRLATKTIEMRHIRRLAQHILDQRTEMEEFFMDSLEYVKEEIKKDKTRELKRNQERYKQSMKELLKNKTAIPEIRSFKAMKSDNAANTLLIKDNPEKDEGKEKVDIKDLTWQDKEKILRILFSKMNGISLAEEAENQARTYDSHNISSKHRSGFAELEPIALQKAGIAIIGGESVSNSVTFPENQNTVSDNTASVPRTEPDLPAALTDNTSDLINISIGQPNGDLADLNDVSGDPPEKAVDAPTEVSEGDDAKVDTLDDLASKSSSALIKKVNNIHTFHKIFQMSAADLEIRKSDSLSDLSQKEEAKQSKIDHLLHLSIDSNIIPRSSIEINGIIPHSLSRFSLQSSVAQDIEKIKEMLAGEMGVSSSVVFDDIKGIVTKLSNKIEAAENATGNASNVINKLLSKLRKTIPALVTNEDVGIQNQDLILQIYGLLILLTSDSNKLSVSTRPLDNAREQLNEKLGILESAAVMQGGDNTASSPIKLFAKLPKQIIDSGLEKPELMRLSAVYELIETEIDYVQDLKTMINFHRQEVANQLSDYDANLIFSNIEQLLMANQALANKMNTKREHNMFVSEIGDLLIDCAESFTVYSVYAANYPAAMKLLTRPEMKELLQKLMEAPDARGLSLESFLIKPVQRICKYPLLIRDLGKYTEKAGNVKDTELLKKAAEKIEAVVTQVNEATRAAEEKQRILGLGNLIESPTPLSFEDKIYLKDGPLLRVEKGGKTKERYIILYTDLILICSPLVRQGPIRGPAKYDLECGYSLTELKFTLNVKDNPNVKNIKNNFLFGLNIISEDKDTILLMANTHDEYTKWTDAFQNAFKDITEEHRSAVRSLEAQQRAIDRQTIGLGFLTGGIGGIRNKAAKSTGLSAIAAKRAASRKSHFSGSGNDAYEFLEPETVKINGIIYKRALSVLGIPYYYNNKEKSAIWKLPDNYQNLDDDLASLDESQSIASISGQAAPGTTKDLEEISEKDTLENAEEQIVVDVQEEVNDVQQEVNDVQQEVNDVQRENEANEQTEIKEVKDVKEVQEEKAEEGANEENNILSFVEGYPNWRKVSRKGTMAYYFHILTQETRWDPPVNQ